MNRETTACYDIMRNTLVKDKRDEMQHISTWFLISDASMTMDGMYWNERGIISYLNMTPPGDIPSFHCSHFLVIYSGSPCKFLRIKSNGTWFKFEFKFKPFSLILKPSHQGRVWNLQILSCNYANLNSYSGRLR
jgi:hypothetical protein